MILTLLAVDMLGALSLAVVLGVLGWLAWRRSSGYRLFKALRRFPGPPPDFFFGIANTGKLLSLGYDSAKVTAFSLDMWRQFSSPITLYFFPVALTHVYSAKQVEVVLKGTANISKSYMYDPLRVWQGDGLSMSKGAKWQSRRKLLTPAFHGPILRPNFHLMEEKLEILMRILKRTVASFPELDIADSISRFTLDVICQSALGYDLQSQENPLDWFHPIHEEFSETFTYRSIRPYLKSDFIFHNFTRLGRRQRIHMKQARQFTLNVTPHLCNTQLTSRREILVQIIKKREAEMLATVDGAAESEDSGDGGIRKRRPFLDLLLELKGQGKLSLDDVREEVDVFVLAGHDTLNTTIKWTMHLLGHHPDIQERCREEVANVTGGAKELGYEELGRLELLDRCLKESMRMFPAVPIISRLIENPITLEPDFSLPAGTVVLLPIVALHRNPEQWPEPERFDPDRFLPSAVATRHPYAFIPFSAGPRNCIGSKFAIMEAKLALSRLLMEFRWTSLTNTPRMNPACHLVLKPTAGLRLHLTPLL